MANKKGGSIALIIVAGVIGICVLSAGGLGIVGYSSFQDYVMRSKTSEASLQLSALYRSSASYYASEQWSGGSALTSCTVGPASTPNQPSSTKTMLLGSQLPESFTAIGWEPYEPIYYRYEIAGGPGACGHGANEALYTFHAYGDLDADGTQSHYSLGARSDASNALARDPGIFIENELE